MPLLEFEPSEDTDGVISLQAMASSPSAAQHAAALAEAQQVLDWAWSQFPDVHGPLDEGHDWDHELQATLEDGRWHVLTLTLAASPRFAQALQAAFPAAFPVAD